VVAVNVKRLRQFLKNIVPKRVLVAYWRYLERRDQARYTNMPIEEVFTEIYASKGWGGVDDDAFYSGTGSHNVDVVEPYIYSVRSILESYEAPPVIVDIGSGDFNVGSQFLDFVEHYYACDIVEELQLYNRRKFTQKNVTFLHLNAVEDSLPLGDILILRQVLQHLSNQNIQQIIPKLATFETIILTEHIPALEYVPNVDVDVGLATRLLAGSGVDLFAPPFNLEGFDNAVICEVQELNGIIRTTLLKRVSKND